MEINTINQTGKDTDDMRKRKANLQDCQTAGKKPVSRRINVKIRPPITVQRIPVRNGCLSVNLLLLANETVKHN
jgi:hypothetical protein